MNITNVPNRMVNIAKLREQAINLIHDASNVSVTLRERVVIGILVTRETGHHTNPLLNTIREDLLDWELPKFTALATWLAPYSLVLQHPDAVGRVAMYLLGHTTEAEDAAIDWDQIRLAYPQL